MFHLTCTNSIINKKSEAICSIPGSIAAKEEEENEGVPALIVNVYFRIFVNHVAVTGKRTDDTYDLCYLFKFFKWYYIYYLFDPYLLIYLMRWTK